MGRVKFHSAFIKGQNDSKKDVEDLFHALLINYTDHPDFNIVMYNPYSPKQGEESQRLGWIAERLRAKTISRVGQDVKASCGMFVKGI